MRSFPLFVAVVGHFVPGQQYPFVLLAGIAIGLVPAFLLQHECGNARVFDNGIALAVAAMCARGVATLVDVEAMRSVRPEEFLLLTYMVVLLPGMVAVFVFRQEGRSGVRISIFDRHQMVKAVIFDFGQTLVDSAGGFRAAEREAQDRIFAVLEGVERGRFMDVYRRVRKSHHEQSRLSRREIWRAVCDELEQGIDERRLVAWEGEYWKRVSALTRVFPEVPSTLDVLRTTHRLALVSNTQGQVGTGAHRLSEFPDLERVFECIVIAGESGIPAKPDALPFLHCLRQMKLDPGECFYVGDDYRFDVCGSRDVGMRPVWLKHRSVRRRWPDVVDTDVAVITSLDELPNLCGTV